MRLDYLCIVCDGYMATNCTALCNRCREAEYQAAKKAKAAATNTNQPTKN